MRIALAQMNPTVGDLAGNLEKSLGFLRAARDRHADLVVFPELSLLGYPPRDLLLKESLVDECQRALETLAREARGISALVGCVERNPSRVGRPLFNAAALVRDGQILARCYKHLLPTYDVFDESRYFEPAQEVCLVEHLGQRLGISICEDIWNDEQFLARQLYSANPMEALARGGAQIVINLSASPFVVGKQQLREELFGHQARRWGVPLVYVNQIGGNDELVFDGNSAVFSAGGKVLARARDFQEDLLVQDLPALEEKPLAPARQGIAAIHGALVLGLRDYAGKCGFKSAVLGLSGGIDSAVVAALAAEALGAQQVLGISLPSRYSSDHSRSDASLLAQALGIRFETLALEAMHRAAESTLSTLFAGTAHGLAEENIQARLRGNLLMAVSNKFGHLLLTTGNKSEVATGYCTLYGDMCGGLALISDLPKMMVYELARYINVQARAAGRAEPIPEGTLTKPPSAELRPNQTDQDSLPPYEILDAILQRYVEEEQSPERIIAAGFDPATVQRVVRLVDLSEYKRKQAAPGIKVTSRAFGFGRRMPIAQRYKPGHKFSS